MSAPMARSTSSNAERDGLSPTPGRRISLSGTIVPATRKKAAAEKSRGIVQVRAGMRMPPRTVR